MKIIKKCLAMLCAALLLCTLFPIAACTPDGPDPGPQLPEKKTYMVAFDVNCDDDVRIPATQEVTEGEKAVRPEDPYRSEFKLSGWYREAECETEFDFDTPVTGHMTLYAGWKSAIETYTVKFDARGGSDVASVSVKEGELVTEPEAPEKAHMYFDGWYTDEACTEAYRFGSPVKNSFTLYAKWLQEVKITYDYNYEECPDAIVVIAKEGSIAENKKVERENYTFGGWYTDSKCEHVYRDAPVTADLTLYALWISEGAATYTYTFHYNFPGAPADVAVEVSAGAIVQAPEFAADGREFKGWYTSAECTEQFDVYSPATDSHEVYAGWWMLYTVTFDYCDENTAEKKVSVREGTAVTQPDEPVRSGYEFLGWYREQGGTAAYNFQDPVTSSFTLYAGWELPSEPYIFEAEYTDLTGVSGAGYSNSAQGTGLIMGSGYANNAFTKASNGFWVGFLNKFGASITYHIHSDADVNDAELILRLSGEHTGGTPGISFTDEEFLVTVNDAKVAYGSLNVKTMFVQDTMKMTFEDFTIGVNLSLKKGDNVIKLLVNNRRKPETGGTMSATAPMVDCIKIKTRQAALSWDPVEDNLKGKR